MGTFSVACKIANHIDRAKAAKIPRVLVDTGSEYTWIAASTLEKLDIEREKKDLQFITATGARVTRSVGFAVIYVENTSTTDEVVFAEKGDLLLLGARTLEGLNLTVDFRKKKLVAAGPLPAASHVSASLLPYGHPRHPTDPRPRPRHYRQLRRAAHAALA